MFEAYFTDYPSAVEANLENLGKAAYIVTKRLILTKG